MSDETGVRFVLVEPSHAGNIGAAARALKTMGYSRLVLVRPCEFNTYECLARASGADDVIDNAEVVETLQEALAPCHRVIGTTARSRSLSWPIAPIRQMAGDLVSRARTQSVAVVFGRERSGLSNDELASCNAMLSIPSSAQFSSLNLASAIQVVAYELHCAEQASLESVTGVEDLGERQPADHNSVENFYQHLQTVMQRTGFLDPANPRLLDLRLRRVFNRVQLDRSELQLLRGFLASVEKKLPPS